MWRLDTPNSSTSPNDLSVALTLVNGNPVYPISATQIDRILELYKKYDDNFGNPSTLLKGMPEEQDLLDAIHNSYSQVQIGGRLEDYRNRLKLNAEICPYCGFGSITDLDHHLPRSVFKAHSIYAKNLIPCCHPCNNIKRAKAGEAPNGQFSHVYLGEYPTEPFLIAEIEVSPAGLTVDFSVIQTPTLNPQEFERLHFQFSILNLNFRYKAPINLFLGTLRTSIEIFSALGAPALKLFLHSNYLSSCQDLGPNHWQSSLLLALSKSSTFCEGGFQYCFGRKDPAI